MTFYNLLEFYMDLGALAYATILLQKIFVAYTSFSKINFNNLYLMSLFRSMLCRMFKDFVLYFFFFFFFLLLLKHACNIKDH
jgi:hypothetical protein